MIYLFFYWSNFRFLKVEIESEHPGMHGEQNCPFIVHKILFIYF